MNDFLTRLIPGFIYVSLLIGSLLYSQFLFVLLMFLFCLIIIFEYGKVLRNDNVHLKSIKVKNKLTEINKKNLFFYTEFTPLLFLISLFILGIIVTFNSSGLNTYFQYVIFFVVLINSFMMIGFVFKGKELFSDKRFMKTWPLIGVVGSFLLIIYSSLIYDYSQFKLFFIYYLILIWGVDSVGYFVGNNFGKNKLYESLSPNKTIEGAVGSIIFSIAYSFIISSYFNSDILFSIILCLITASFAIFGDLVQSKIKRELDIKDFGNLLKGHGGLYDRLDSIIFSFPFIYLILTIYIYVS